MKKFSLAFSKRNFVFSCICLGGLTLLVLITILPFVAQIKLIEIERPQVEAQISEQEELAEIIKTIDIKLAELNEMPSLPSISLTSIPLVETSSVLGEIKAIAQDEHLEMITIEPIIPKSGIQLKTVTFNTEMKGKLADIRSFLFALLQVSYINKIDTLKIISTEDRLKLDLTFSVRLS